MATDLIDRAQAGDEQAFSQLVEPYQRELEVHCYRILGSAQDAEDAVQETLLTAWRSLGGFEQRSSLRTWLYRIATTRSLNARLPRQRGGGHPGDQRAVGGKRPQARPRHPRAPPAATRTAADAPALPRRGRTRRPSHPGVRGRGRGRHRRPAHRRRLADHAPGATGVPGPRALRTILQLVFGLGRRYRLVATRANGQPAFGIYAFDPHAPVLHANGLIVITLAGERISRIDRFDNSVLPRFGLPRSLPA